MAKQKDKSQNHSRVSKSSRKDNRYDVKSDSTQKDYLNIRVAEMKRRTTSPKIEKLLELNNNRGNK